MKIFFVIVGIFFSMKWQSGFAQIMPFKISGLVKCETGAGIEGVSVIIQESKQGSVTNLMGRFTIGDIKLEEFTIEFSGTGYRTKSIRIDRQYLQNEINIVLEKFIPEMTAIRIWGKTDPLASVQRMADISGTFLTAGKKNEIINISNADANIALKSGRQFFAKIPGVFVYDMDGSGNQVNIATRGLDPHEAGNSISGIMELLLILICTATRPVILTRQWNPLKKWN